MLGLWMPGPHEILYAASPFTGLLLIVLGVRKKKPALWAAGIVVLGLWLTVYGDVTREILRHMGFRS